MSCYTEKNGDSFVTIDSVTSLHPTVIPALFVPVCKLLKIIRFTNSVTEEDRTVKWRGFRRVQNTCREADVWTRMQGRTRKSVWCLGLKPRKHQRARHDFSVGLLAPLQAEVHWQRRSNASMQPLRTPHLTRQVYLYVMSDQAHRGKIGIFGAN